MPDEWIWAPPHQRQLLSALGQKIRQIKVQMTQSQNQPQVLHLLSKHSTQQIPVWSKFCLWHCHHQHYPTVLCGSQRCGYDLWWLSHLLSSPLIPHMCSSETAVDDSAISNTNSKITQGIAGSEGVDELKPYLRHRFHDGTFSVRFGDVIRFETDDTVTVYSWDDKATHITFVDPAFTSTMTVNNDRECVINSRDVSVSTEKGGFRVQITKRTKDTTPGRSTQRLLLVYCKVLTNLNPLLTDWTCHWCHSVCHVWFRIFQPPKNQYTIHQQKFSCHKVKVHNSQASEEHSCAQYIKHCRAAPRSARQIHRKTDWGGPQALTCKTSQTMWAWCLPLEMTQWKRGDCSTIAGIGMSLIGLRC